MKLHIGKKIEEVFKKSGMTKASFARRIEVTPRNVYDIFNRESLDTQLLTRVGKALDYNFFELYIPEESIVKEPEPVYNKNEIVIKFETGENSEDAQELMRKMADALEEFNKARAAK